MKDSIKKLEQGALLYAQQELTNSIIGAEYIGSMGGISYFEPRFKPSLESSTGLIHLITHINGKYGVTFDQEEIEGVNAKFF